jgi:hypothetical protein
MHYVTHEVFFHRDLSADHSNWTERKFVPNSPLRFQAVLMEFIYRKPSTCCMKLLTRNDPKQSKLV